jgi:hypothetical protein
MACFAHSQSLAIHETKEASMSENADMQASDKNDKEPDDRPSNSRWWRKLTLTVTSAAVAGVIRALLDWALRESHP